VYKGNLTSHRDGFGNKKTSQTLSQVLGNTMVYILKEGNLVICDNLDESTRYYIK
jgi:hypothetical protein